jgi:hypothetical protein
MRWQIASIAPVAGEAVISDTESRCKDDDKDESDHYGDSENTYPDGHAAIHDRDLPRLRTESVDAGVRHRRTTCTCDERSV